MAFSAPSLILALLLSAPALQAQVPLDKMEPANRILAEEILRKPQFTFQTTTAPVDVRVATMEKLFDHPRLAAAMWRECQFVPRLFAFTLPDNGLVVDDTRGLKGTMLLAYREPGKRVYLIDGRVERWRMGNPVAVGARMVVIYTYWHGPKGFQSHLQAWTTLDSAILGTLTRPFRNYIQRRQEEFMAYILANMSHGGEFAEHSYEDFLGPIRREGDPVAVRNYLEAFGQRK